MTIVCTLADFWFWFPSFSYRRLFSFHSESYNAEIKKRGKCQQTKTMNWGRFFSLFSCVLLVYARLAWTATSLCTTQWTVVHTSERKKIKIKLIKKTPRIEWKTKNKTTATPMLVKSSAENGILLLLLLRLIEQKTTRNRRFTAKRDYAHVKRLFFLFNVCVCEFLCLLFQSMTAKL